MSLFAYKNETKKSKTTIKSKINIYLTNGDAHSRYLFLPDIFCICFSSIYISMYYHLLFTRLSSRHYFPLMVIVGC